MKILSKLLLIVLILALTLGGAACSPKPDDTDGITVTDLIGRNVTVRPGSYTRVVCIGAGALRMYCYIGDTSLLCGVEDIDNLSLADRPKMFDGSPRPYVLAFGDVFATLPSCGVGGPNAQSAEAEKILSCRPDLVLSEYQDKEKADALQAQLGVPVLTLRSGSAGVFAEDFLTSLTLLGTVLGRESRAETLVSYLKNEQYELSLRTAFPSESEKPDVYIGGLGNWGTTNHLYTAEHYEPFVILHIQNVVRDLGFSGIGPIENEKFVSLGPDTDILFLDAAAVKNIRPLYRQDPSLWDFCRAWKEDRAYLLMAYNSYYTNYELALANAWFMAATVYPESFEDLDIRAKLDEITEMFLGVPLAEEIYACPDSFGGYRRISDDFFAS